MPGQSERPAVSARLLSRELRTVARAATCQPAYRNGTLECSSCRLPGSTCPRTRSMPLFCLTIHRRVASTAACIASLGRELVEAGVHRVVLEATGGLARGLSALGRRSSRQPGAHLRLSQEPGHPGQDRQAGRRRHRPLRSGYGLVRTQTAHGRSTGDQGSCGRRRQLVEMIAADV